MRIRPLAALSAAALSAVLLAGCSSSAPDTETSPSAPPTADLCAAAAPAGAASDAVTVEGTAGEASTAAFEFPLEIPEVQTTVISEGTGDPVESGQLVMYAFTAYNAETGQELGSLGYGEDPVLPAQISPDSPLGQILGCATPGTRVVAALPASDTNAGEVYIFDFVDTVPDAAWGDPQEPVEGMPTVDSRRRRRADDRAARGRRSDRGRARGARRRATARPSRPATPCSSSTPA